MSNTALPVEWTAGADLIQHPPRRAITDRTLPKKAIFKEHGRLTITFQRPARGSWMYLKVFLTSYMTGC
jgi:hypothetical protein